MNKPLVINKVAEQMGLTSRTLRHWESEKLFSSIRDVESGWRTYDENAILCIQITTFLRKMDVPIKEIKSVIDCMNICKLYEVISNKIMALDIDSEEIIFRRKHLEQLLSFLSERRNLPINVESLFLIQEVIRKFENIEKEDLSMVNYSTTDHIKFITLPAMRMVYHIAISTSPEDEAMEPVLNWIKSANLLGTARLFGGNMKPMPSGEGKPYGYGFCASIPESVAIPEHLKEMTLPGGLYAVIESTDDIEVSWKILMKHLSGHDKYKSDRSRLCLEEHIRNDNTEGCGNEYSLRLMEPVKLK
ncbi:MAG: MerR family transcriptional regulator [Herbinix sp.]|nr:MerR family transcriptional regulator [Herbinix sp.]